MASDTQIFRQILAWLQQQEAVYLLTIVSVEEHAPMPAGSLLAFNTSGDRIGAMLREEPDDRIIRQLIEGGLDRLSLPALIHLPSESLPLEFEAGENQPRLKVLVESVESSAQVHAILAALEQGKLISRNLCLDTGESSLHISLHPAPDNLRLQFDDHNVRSLYHPDEVLLLVGSDEIAQALANTANSLGYAVVICAPAQPRPASLPEQVQWTSRPVEDAIRETILHPYCSVVVLDTHTSLSDRAAMSALDTPARYIGILGSSVSAKQRSERLLENGIREESLQRLHSPAGLPIGSHTPEEIAVAILSEMIASEHALHVSLVTSGQKKRVLFASRPVSAEIVRPTVERTRCSIKDMPLGNPWKDCCSVDTADDEDK